MVTSLNRSFNYHPLSIAEHVVKNKLFRDSSLAAFGDDGFGTGGTDNPINGGGMAGTMMIAIQDPQERVLGMEERLKALEAR